jgi:hypothetical protein
MTKPINVMIDLETLGTTETAHILSIGLCTFSLEEGVRNQDEKILLQPGAAEQGRTIDIDTLSWWLAQSPELFRRTLVDKTTLKDALERLSSQLASYRFGPTRVNLWCNGANFDFAILRDAFNQMGMAVPWKYYDENCIRGLKTISADINEVYKRTNMSLDDKGILIEPHNALSDAIWQAEFVACASNQLRVLK